MLLAVDLMRVAADLETDLAATYGPAIEAELAFVQSMLPEVRDEDPSAAGPLLLLQEEAQSTYVLAAQGRLRADIFREATAHIGRESQQMHAAWLCERGEDDAEPAAGDALGEAVVDGPNDPNVAGRTTFSAVSMAGSTPGFRQWTMFLGLALLAAASATVLIRIDKRRRRRARRYIFLEKSEVVVGETIHKAQIFDISVTGARLMVPVVIPPQTPLTISLGGKPRAAEVVRSGEGYAGVRFQQEFRTVELLKILRAAGKQPT